MSFSLLPQTCTGQKLPMDKHLLVLGMLVGLGVSALMAAGYWLARDGWQQKAGTPEPKVKVPEVSVSAPSLSTLPPRVRVRRIGRYIPPQPMRPRTAADTNSSRPNVILRAQRRIKLRDYPQGYRPNLVVERQLHPLYQEKGWRKEGRLYRGYYRVDGSRWRGEIVEHHQGFYEAFIYNPPLQQLDRHPHGPCFNRCSDRGRFHVHFQEMPKNVDHIIVNVETILSEARGVCDKIIGR